MERIIDRKLLDKERLLIEESKFSSIQWQACMKMLRLPDRVRGLKILDVGAGGSDLVAHLLEEGADAYAIDPKYQNTKAAIDWMRFVYQHTDQMPQSDLQKRLQALDRFQSSQQTNPDRYKKASALSIPFPDGYFDFVYSLSTVTVYLDHDLEVLQAAIQECLRVTSIRGQIQLYPYMEREVGFDKETDDLRLQNQTQMMSWLLDNPQADTRVITIHQFGDEFRLLVINKRYHSP